MLLISACFYLFVYFCTRFFLCFDIFSLLAKSVLKEHSRCGNHRNHCKNNTCSHNFFPFRS